MARRWLILADDLTARPIAPSPSPGAGPRPACNGARRGPGRTRRSCRTMPTAASSARTPRRPATPPWRSGCTTRTGPCSRRSTRPCAGSRRRNSPPPSTSCAGAMAAPSRSWRRPSRRPAAPPRTGGSGSPAGRSRRPSSGAGTTPTRPTRSRRCWTGAGSPARRSRSPPCGPAARPGHALAAASRDSAVAVLDAVEDDDLARIARAGLALDAAGLVWIGSAGLAHALAAAEAASPAPARAIASGPGGTLVVVGASRPSPAPRPAGWRPGRGCATSRWRPTGSSTRARPSGGAGATRSPRASPSGTTCWSRSRWARRRISPSARASRPRSARCSPRPLPHLGALVATGGETAAALLARFGVDGLALIDEIEPGVSLGVTRGRIAVPIVTKAGAFGSEDTLLRAVHHLRAIRHEGSPT